MSECDDILGDVLDDVAAGLPDRHTGETWEEYADTGDAIAYGNLAVASLMREHIAEATSAVYRIGRRNREHERDAARLRIECGDLRKALAASQEAERLLREALHAAGEVAEGLPGRGTGPVQSGTYALCRFGVIFDPIDDEEHGCHPTWRPIEEPWGFSGPGRGPRPARTNATTASEVAAAMGLPPDADVMGHLMRLGIEAGTNAEDGTPLPRPDRTPLDESANDAMVAEIAELIFADFPPHMEVPAKSTPMEGGRKTDLWPDGHMTWTDDDGVRHWGEHPKERMTDA